MGRKRTQLAPYRGRETAVTVLLAVLILTAAVLSPLTAQAAAGTPDRTVLPVAAPAPPEFTELDVRNVTPPPLFSVKAPEGAPNVIVVLVDDLGFAGTGTFGGPVSTPTFDRLAGEGIYFNNFHTTAVCSPTRAAIKSGRNHHVNNMGGIIETGTAFPGNTGQIPDTVAPVCGKQRCRVPHMIVSYPRGGEMSSPRTAKAVTTNRLPPFWRGAPSTALLALRF